MEYDFKKASERMAQRRFYIRMLKKNNGMYQETGLPEPQVSKSEEKEILKKNKSRVLDS